MANRKPVILVTNDDGYLSQGLLTLAEAAATLGEVFVVSPQQAMSGMSHAITASRPLRVHRHPMDRVENFYVCNGTPVDCIKLGLHKIMPVRPDMILSGINYGSNAAASTHYSGTVAAAREGALHGIASIAFSSLNTDISDTLDYCSGIVKQIITEILKNPPAKGCLLNVNIPNLPQSQIKGIRICRLAQGFWKETFDTRKDPAGRDYNWLEGKFINAEPSSPETDETALYDGYVAVVPLKVDSTDYESITSLRTYDFAVNH